MADQPATLTSIAQKLTHTTGSSTKTASIQSHCNANGIILFTADMKPTNSSSSQQACTGPATQLTWHQYKILQRPLLYVHTAASQVNLSMLHFNIPNKHGLLSTVSITESYNSNDPINTQTADFISTLSKIFWNKY